MLLDSPACRSLPSGPCLSVPACRSPLVDPCLSSLPLSVPACRSLLVLVPSKVRQTKPKNFSSTSSHPPHPHVLTSSHPHTFTSHHIPSHPITSYRIPSHPITSHHSYKMTSPSSPPPPAPPSIEIWRVMDFSGNTMYLRPGLTLHVDDTKTYCMFVSAQT